MKKRKPPIDWVDQRTFVDSAGYFRIADAMSCEYSHVPKGLREPDEGVIHVTSVVDAFQDPATNPLSGGVVGLKPMAAYLGRHPRTLQRTLFKEPYRSELRWAHRVPASNTASLDAIRERFDAQARNSHLAALGIIDTSSGGMALNSYTVVSSGSTIM